MISPQLLTDGRVGEVEHVAQDMIPYPHLVGMALAVLLLAIQWPRRRDG